MKTYEFISNWSDKVISVKTEGLTENELEVMRAIRTNHYSDIYESDGDWSFAVCDASGLSEKVYRGVAASLVKKGIIEISDNEEKGRFRDMILELTEKGRELYEEREL